MEIENRAEDTIIGVISDYPPGTIFEINCHVYMTIKELFIPSKNDEIGTTYNAVNLETGAIEYIHTVPENKVYLCLDAKIDLRPNH